MKFTAYVITVMTVFMILISNFSFGQEKILQGRVVAAGGTPVFGATVQERGSRNAVTSDADGKFTIKLSKPGAVLVISYVGYLAQEIRIGDQSMLDVMLAESKNAQLNEVVVTALGIKKEDRKVGYAVQTVKGSDLTKAREPDVFNSLEGKVAGVTIGTSPELMGRPQIISRGTKGNPY